MYRQRGDQRLAQVEERLARTHELIAADVELVIDRLTRLEQAPTSPMKQTEAVRTAERRQRTYARVHRDRGQITRAHYHEDAAEGLAILGDMLQDELKGQPPSAHAHDPQMPRDMRLTLGTPRRAVSGEPTGPSPFDRALATRALRSAAEEYALEHGRPGTSEYRLAWSRFHQQTRGSKPRRGVRRTANGVRPSLPKGGKRPPSSSLTRNVRELLDVAIQKAIRVDGATAANAQLLEPRGRSLRLVAHHGFPAEFLAFFNVVNDTTTACGSALEQGTPVLIPDITNSPVFARTAGLQVMLRAGSRAVASLPVRAPNGRVIAMISTHHPRATTWTDHRLLALQELCTSTGRLLHQALAAAAPGP